VPGDAFAGNDGPVNLEGDSEDVLKVLLDDESEPAADDVVEPILDE
jgi:hypothetical protein